MRTHTRLASVFITGILSLTGCMNYMPRLDNPLSTAASMRVEVEVYKGPLSKNVSVQWGELEGLVDEAADALTTFNDGIVTAGARAGFVTDCATCEAAYCDTTCEVTDCTTCEAKVSIDPHYRSEKIAEQNIKNPNKDRILPRTMRPEIDTRTVYKVGESSMHDGNDPSEKPLWCANGKLQKNKQSLIGCHILSNMHGDVRVLLEELNTLHASMMQRSITVGPSEQPFEEVIDNFNRIYTLLLAAKDKTDLLKDSCAEAYELNEALSTIRTNLKEAKGILEKNERVWDDIKEASNALAGALDNMPVNLKDNLAAKIIPDGAIDLSQRISARVLSSIESVEGMVSPIAAETHLPLPFAIHPSTVVEWSRELESAANEIGQLLDFFFKQVRGCQKLEGTSCEQRKRIMERVGRVAIKLKAKAVYWAETHVGIAPQEREVRIAVAIFANLASEYSNQLESLADGLQWQLGEDGKRMKARQLPLSVYLRNAEATDFLNLYTWYRAAAPAIWEEMLLHPFNAFTSNETADRVRVIERLFADHNWEKINTVYGSGQGDFSMALIKDEIGNWNLKSFDSDPTELLKAYTNFAKFALSTVSSKGIALLAELDGVLGSSKGLNMNALHKRVVKELRAIKVPEQEQCFVQCTNASDKVIKRIRDILSDYEAVIDTLQESLTPNF